MTYFGLWSGPLVLVVAAYIGTFTVAGLVLFVTLTVTGVAGRLGEVPGRVRARRERILAEREARRA